MASDLEKQNLEVHVELCAVRYSNLEDKLNGLETRMDSVEQHLVDIKSTITDNSHDQYRTLIKVGATIIGTLITAVAFLVWNFILSK